jgi:hypothetical protein
MVIIGWVLTFPLQAQSSLSNNKTKTNNMKEFSFLVRVPVTYSREQVAAANVKWNALLEQWKKEEIYITSFPFPGEGFVVAGKEKAIKKESVISNNLRVVSNVFLRAKDFDQALELAQTFPILEYEGTVEVREIPPRPVQSN